MVHAVFGLFVIDMMFFPAYDGVGACCISLLTFFRDVLLCKVFFFSDIFRFSVHFLAFTYLNRMVSEFISRIVVTFLKCF